MLKLTLHKHDHFMTHRSIRHTLLILSTTLLSACTVGKDYVAPKLDIPATWSETARNDYADKAIDKSATSQTGPWWNRLNDETLTKLIEKGLANNYDLKIAQARIDEAKANEERAFSALMPQIDATASFTRREQGILPRGSIMDTDKRAGLNGSLDIDLFGENRRRLEAAKANIDAANGVLGQTQLSLVTEIARNYIRLRSAQAQYVIVEKNLQMQHNTLDITRGQREEEVVTDLEVLRADAQAGFTEARLPQLQSTITSALNRISVLTGEAPGSIDELIKDRKPIPNVPSSVVLATPIEAISRRPDMRVAERRLAESSALSNAAFAQYFPKLSLEGFFGFQHSGLYGSISPWTAGINSLFPLLNFGRISSQVDAAKSRELQALYNYKQTLLFALEDTENALSNYMNQRKRMNTLARVAEAQARASYIAREQYDSGIITQLDLLTTQNDQLNAESEYALSEAAVAESLILLYQALGETWLPTEAPPTADEQNTQPPRRDTTS